MSHTPRLLHVIEQNERDAVADVTHCGGDDCTDCEVGTALRKARGEA